MPSGSTLPIRLTTPPTPASMPSMSGVTHEKIDWKTNAITARNTSGPSTRCKSTRSRRSVRRCGRSCTMHAASRMSSFK